MLTSLFSVKRDSQHILTAGAAPFILTVDKGCLFGYLKIGYCEIRDFLRRRK